MNKSILGNLTGVRFYAAFMVLLYHFTKGESYQLGGFLDNVISNGYLGVNFFYILSGFILSFNYFKKPDFLTSESIKKFFVARVARIYPLYFLAGFLIIFIRGISFSNNGNLDTLTSQTFLTKSALYISMLQNWFVHHLDFLYPPSWSISCEIFFYGVFPLLMPFILGTKRALTGIVLCWVALIVPAALASFQPDTSSLYYTIKYNPIVHLPAFIMGMLIARIHQNQKTKISPPVFYGCIFTLLIISGIELVPKILLHNGLLAPCFALMILYLASNTDKFTQGLFSNKLIYLLGQISYGVYILQGPLYELFHKAYKTYLGLPPTGWIFFSLFSIFLFALSYVAFKLVEEPMQKSIMGTYTCLKLRKMGGSALGN